jgi:hypothetical protein
VLPGAGDGAGADRGEPPRRRQPASPRTLPAPSHSTPGCVPDKSAS